MDLLKGLAINEWLAFSKIFVMSKQISPCWSNSKVPIITLSIRLGIHVSHLNMRHRCIIVIVVYTRALFWRAARRYSLLKFQISEHYFTFAITEIDVKNFKLCDHNHIVTKSRTYVRSKINRVIKHRIYDILTLRYRNYFWFVRARTLTRGDGDTCVVSGGARRVDWAFA